MFEMSWQAIAVCLTAVGMIGALAVWVVNLRLRAFEHKLNVMLAEARRELLNDINGAFVRVDVFKSTIDPVAQGITRLQDGQTRLWGRFDEIAKSPAPDLYA